MNLLVGSTGFVGGHVVEYLFQQNEISKGVFRKGSRLKTMDLNGVQGVEADLLDHHSLHEAVEGVDTIYSMASPSPAKGGDYRINTEGIVNLLEVARESGVKTIVHLSTLDVYGFDAGKVTDASQPKPTGEYQKSKLEADRIMLEFAKRVEEPRVTIVRPARAVGSRDPSLVVPLVRMIQSGKVVIPFAGPMSFSHPKDIAAAMHRAATGTQQTGRVYLISSFDSTSTELANGIANSLGRRVELKGAGTLSKSGLPPYTNDQLKASLLLGPQSGWANLGYSPRYGLQRTCDEIAEWLGKEPWAVDEV